MAPRTPLSEKEFYLHAFKHRSILFHLADGLRLVEVAAVVERLVANSTMVVVSGGPRAGLGRGAYRKLDPAGGPALVALSRELVDKGRAAVVAGKQASGVPRLRSSVALATALGISKLVLVDPRGGLSRAGERMSFVTTARLARLSPPGPWTARELELCRRALAGLGELAGPRDAGAIAAVTAALPSDDAAAALGAILGRKEGEA